MMQHFLLSGMLNMLFVGILIQKLIIFSILSEFNLSRKGSNS